VQWNEGRFLQGVVFCNRMKGVFAMERRVCFCNIMKRGQWNEGGFLQLNEGAMERRVCFCNRMSHPSNAVAVGFTYDL
jgi:hypothetical protein